MDGIISREVYIYILRRGLTCGMAITRHSLRVLGGFLSLHSAILVLVENAETVLGQSIAAYVERTFL